MIHSDLASLIHLVRGRRVMLSQDLARLYGVEPRALVQAVKRNRSNFPDDFAFRAVPEEAERLRFQIGTSKKGRGGRRYLPWLFTENILIIRAFVKMRELAAQNREILAKLSELERRVGRNETDIGAIIDAIRKEAGGAPPPPDKRRIGFQT